MPIIIVSVSYFLEHLDKSYFFAIFVIGFSWLLSKSLLASF